MDRNHNVITFRVANFADIIKVSVMLIKPTFKDPIKLQIIRNYVLTCNFYLHFLTKQKLLIYGD